MKKPSIKLYFLLFPLAIVLAFFANKLTNYKSEAKSLNILNGTISYADDPAGYYKKTLIKSFSPEPDWQPAEDFGTSTQPIISGESALMVDLNSGKILFDKNPTQRMKIASITKIMTAIVALEHEKLDAKIYVTKHAAYVGEDTMYLTAGEVYTLHELLYGLFLNSGNDAAYAIADGIAGDSDTFVKWMNMKAQELGLNNTKFTDPSGLDDDTYSTAEDLIKLARYALKNPDFRDIVKTHDIELKSDTHKDLFLENETNLLTSYPGVEGIKTGYTEEAGLCLVTYAENGGKRLLGVVLKSMDRKGDMVLMLDHSFETLGITVIHPGFF